MLGLNLKNHVRYIIKVIDQFAFPFTCIMLGLYVANHVPYIIKGIDQLQIHSTVSLDGTHEHLAQVGICRYLLKVAALVEMN